MDVKLLDFGLAKLLPNAVNLRAFRTATGAQLGTPDYMSPEQLRGDKEVDARTDVYALGVLAFEILLGKRPRRFSDGTFDMDGKAPAQLLSFVPTELAQLVEAMLAADPLQRPSLAAVRAVIKRVMPTLPPLSVVAMPVRAIGSDPQLDSMPPSAVGARPELPTPPAGSPALRRLVSEAEQAFVPAPDPAPPSRPSQPAVSSPALRTSATHPSTTLGVPPPPPRVSRPQPVAAPEKPRESRRWLLVGLALVVAAGIALAIVLAT
jgi:serine/threonine-protein kinase